MGMGSPFIIEWASVKYQLESLNGFYKNYYPKTFQDAEYRIPLLKSAAALFSVWPIAVATSYLVGKGFRIANHALQQSDHRVARWVRDMNKDWGDHAEPWARITTMACRLSAYTNYSVFAALAKRVLRQRALIPALVNGLKVTQTIKADSELGKLSGVERDIKLGINNPFTASEQLEKDTNARIRAQSLLVQQERRAESLAWILAAVAVSNESGVDPATLTQFAEKGIDTNWFNELASNGRSSRSWLVIAEDLKKALIELNIIGVDINTELDPAKIAEAFGIARKIAAEVKALPQGTVNAKISFNKFKAMLRVGRSVPFTFGQAESEFLSRVVTNSFVSGQVKHQFILDYSGMVVLPTGWGDRADFNHPESLAADKNGPLWSNPGHIVDMTQQIYIYLFSVGARMALVYQRLTAKAEEMYRPWAEVEFEPKDRTETLKSGMINWFKAVASVKRADMGHLFVFQEYKSLKTIQNAIAMQLVTRLLIGGQSLATATIAWAYTRVWGTWAFAWPWTPISQGNDLVQERIAEMKEELRVVQDKMSQALRESNDARAVEALRSNYSELFQLYNKHSPGSVSIFAKWARVTGGRETSPTVISEVFSSAEKVLIEKGFDGLVQGNRRALAGGEHYFGLVVGLSEALKRNDVMGVKSFEAKLRAAIGKTTDIPAADLERMNATTLLKYSVERPPIFTKHNPILDQSTIFAGAVITTVLGISMMVDSFNANLMTWSNVGYRALLSYGMIYPIVWLALSAKSHELFKEFVRSPVQFYNARKYGKNSERAIELEKQGRAGVTVRACKDIFRSLYFTDIH